MGWSVEGVEDWLVGRGSRGLVYQIIFTETSEIFTNFSFILLFF